MFVPSDRTVPGAAAAADAHPHSAVPRIGAARGFRCRDQRHCPRHWFAADDRTTLGDRMTDTEQLQRILHLRGKGATPRHIARTLGMRPVEVSAALRQAATARAAEAGPGPLLGCWLSAGWATGLTVRRHPEWPGLNGHDPAAGGLVAVLIARRDRHDQVSACGYLVDVYCLGVKNTLGPRLLGDLDFVALRRSFFSGYRDEPLAAPLDLAQQLVLGATDYARNLGFEPHPDYAAAAGHLGTGDGARDIEFGHDGRPLFIQGPFDDPRRILRALGTTIEADDRDLMPAGAPPG
jgi:hypothetical protein